MLRAAVVIVLLAAGCASTAPPPTSRPTNAPTAAGSTALPPSPEPTSGSSASPSTTATERPTPRPAFGDGTHLVPADVAPGTYRTVAYADSCYWVRLSGFDSGLEDWVASGIGPGYHVVTIGESDAGFDSQGCGAWTGDLEAVVSSVDEIGEGTYIVGTDLEPGEWSATSGDNCYWARLSGFGGTEVEVTQQALVTAGEPPVVRIADSDVGFTSNGCGTWQSAAQ